MFGRRRNNRSNAGKKRVIHTPECTAIHEAMLMSLYLGYGAPSAPLFIPTGSLVCTCSDDTPDNNTVKSTTPETETRNDFLRLLVSA